jgi:REP element-mobilizing transposase RayT
MPQSLSKVLVHLVFSTKNREAWLGENLRPEVHRYLGGVASHQGCDPLCVGGVADHVHLLCVLSRTMTQADLVMELKRASSRWIKQRFEGMAGFAWQNGYGAFSIGQSQLAEVVRYIESQDEHHRRVGFQEEYRAFLKRYGLEPDERYVWD